MVITLKFFSTKLLLQHLYRVYVPYALVSTLQAKPHPVALWVWKAQLLRTVGLKRPFVITLLRPHGHTTCQIAHQPSVFKKFTTFTSAGTSPSPSPSAAVASICRPLLGMDWGDPPRAFTAIHLLCSASRVSLPYILNNEWMNESTLLFSESRQ